jgi:hypothetical protein
VDYTAFPQKMGDRECLLKDYEQLNGGIDEEHEENRDHRRIADAASLDISRVVG